MAINKGTVIKIVELVIVCILIGLHYHSASDRGLNTAMLTMGAFGGYLIILAGLLFAILLGAALDRRVDMFFSVVGFILFVVVGGLIIDHFANMYRGSVRDTGIAKGCISIVEGIVFLIDAILVYRGQ
ncbi:uncharacterized protein LOC108631277 [Ceratina calcarata]|uniref:Uncharacterized protein LOC108631277 n=1 Tax=Ceratina calcarata TaxID=156304 RepID=A0AAJ7WGI7_9HYME|nr:uncharacterized protein LOC108631277 [Ceratina calcarata]XP_026674548.1 uncharacterized protein LOC108631277 [Ceratina calcarata]